MLEQLKYVNHLGETIEFGSGGLFVNYNDLRDYDWDYSSKNEKIVAFNRGIVEKTIPLVICCNNPAQGLNLRNILFEICEKDVLALRPGKIIIGGHYLKCYVTGSKKEDYLISNGMLSTELTITTDSGFWIKETKYECRMLDDNEGQNLDYFYDFPYDFESKKGDKTRIINNTAVTSANFEITIFGPCLHPTIAIAGRPYTVYASLRIGESLTINSATKKIYKTKITDDIINQFDLRDRNHYVFEQIPAGQHSVVWDGSFDFDLKLIEERSEPKWI